MAQALQRRRGTYLELPHAAALRTLSTRMLHLPCAAQVWYHPYSLHVLAMVLGFSLVIRIQIAYQRFWEGTSMCHLAAAKWGDAAMQVFAFDEASKDAFAETGFEFRMLILHYTSLMTACALIDIRRDDEDLQAPMTVNYEDPYMFRAMVENKGGTPAPEEAARRVSLENEMELDKIIQSGALPGTVPTTERSTPLTHTSGRDGAVPLQKMLQTRRNLQAHQKDPINSFAPVLSKAQGKRPASFGTSALDLRCRNTVSASSPGHSGASGAAQPVARRQSCLPCFRRTPATVPSSGTAPSARDGKSTSGVEESSRLDDGASVRERTGRPTEERLRRGSASNTEYLNAAIFMRASIKTKQRLARANQFDVVGGVSQAEIDILSNVAPGDRAYVVQTWIVRLMTNRLAAGGLAIPPPLLSRTYQVLSDGTAAAMQARKVSHVAFPFPLRQLLVLLLGVFIVLAPICIASFMRSVELVGVLSFFVCLGYTALNETAAELENPFGLGANHHRLTTYMRQFNSKLARLFDLTIPNLGYKPPAPLEQKQRAAPAVAARGAKATVQEAAVKAAAPASETECSSAGNNAKPATSNATEGSDEPPPHPKPTTISFGPSTADTEMEA